MKKTATALGGPLGRALRYFKWALGLLLLVGPAARAQAPAWQAAVTPGGTGSFEVYASGTDASGNLYVAGGFSGTITFGTTTLTSAGQRDAYVAKWSPATSSFVWAQRAGGTGEEYVNSLAVSGTSIYLTGVFGSRQATFGSSILTNASNGSTGLYDGYVAKLTDAGTSAGFVWARGYGGSTDDYGNGLVVNGANVYVSGIFNSPTCTFGTITLANLDSSTGVSINSTDVYVAKLVDAGSQGSFGWAERLGGSDSDYCSSMTSSGGSVYVAGSFSSATVAIGNKALTNVGPIGTEDVFVAKFTDTGAAPSFAWAQRAGGAGSESARDIAFSQNNVYITGRMYGATTATFGNTVLTNAGQIDAYVAKLADAPTSASVAWAQQLGGTGNDLAYGIAVRGSSVYAVGSFQNVAAFGATSLTSAGSDDIFVTRLLDAGPSTSFAWVQQAGSTDTDEASSVLLLGSRVYVGGQFSSSISFGSTTLTSQANSSAGFLAFMTDAAGLATTPGGPLTDLSLYPNPARATATVQLPPVPGAATATLALLDAVGRVVRTTAVALPPAGLRHELDLRGLPAGLYAVRVAAGGRTATQRLVVE